MIAACPLVALALCSSLASAQVRRYDGGGSNNNWNNNSNWSSNDKPNSTSESARFNGSDNGDNSVDLNGVSFTIGQIEVDSPNNLNRIKNDQATDSTLTLSPGSFGGVGVDMSAATVNFQFRNVSGTRNWILRLGASQTWNVNSGGGAGNLTSHNGVDLRLNSKTLTTNIGSGRAITVQGTITGTNTNSKIVKTGNGTLALRHGSNTFGGSLTVRNGLVTLRSDAGGNNVASGNVIVNAVDDGTAELRLLEAHEITDTKNVTLQNGGEFDLQTYNETINKLTLTDGTVNGSGILTSTVDIDARSGTVNARLAGSVGLDKTTGGTVTLANANTYTGVTTISNGTLALTGSGSINNSSQIDVASGAEFDITALAGYTFSGDLTGDGTFDGDITASGNVAPGTSVGTLTFNNDLDLTGTLEIEVDGTGAGSVDRINVTGDLDISAATVNFSEVATPDDKPYVFASYGTLTGPSFASVTGLPSGYYINYNYNGLNQIGLVPEPSTFALAAIGLLGLLGWGRRRRRTKY